MKRLFLTAVIAAAALTACEKNPYGPTGYQPGGQEQETPVEPSGPAEYIKGADISWVTQMEQDGQKFYNADGTETECTALMKELGFNAIRLRVWVDPEDGWCNGADVLVKAKRAQALGMKIMVDFHYSDTWADPSSQKTPAAWAEYDLGNMMTAVAGHTSEVLQLLKDNGVEVEWIQTGNEVNVGMLHPLGKVEDRTYENFVSLARAGRNAARKVYPDVKTIIHISNGHEPGLFDWFFNLMKLGGAEYDIIGMSLYPTWWENNGWCDWKPAVEDCIANIKSISSKYGKPVMICEFGMQVSDPQTSKEAVVYLLEETKKIEECLGLFWWEPQTDGVWKPSTYQALGWGAYDKGAFRNGRATAALEPFKE